MPPITPCLWFDTEAEAAVELYTTVFEDATGGTVARYDAATAAVSGQPEGSTRTVEFDLEGQPFIALNGGPQFPFTPAISFIVNCPSAGDVDRRWTALIEGGTSLMPLESYPFSERYGWLTDRFGVSWQLTAAAPDVSQRIVPSLLFTGDRLGQAEAALEHYATVFDDGHVEHLERYGPGDPDNKAGTVQYGSCVLDGYHLTAMDSGFDHEFGFNESISFMVACDDQADLDRTWDQLIGDAGEPGPCGWLTDPFGVSWQVVPAGIGELVDGPDAAGAARATEAMLEMGKLDIAALEAAYEGR